MKFCYHKDAGSETLCIQDQLFSHLYKVRRTNIKDQILFCNLQDEKLYAYKHEEITKKFALLKLVSSQSYESIKKNTHLIWAIINTKNIYSTLPYLNQLGVSKISFFYAERSQKNEKINLEKCHQILIQSCEQSGRNHLMKLEIFSSLNDILNRYPKASMIHFDAEPLTRYHLPDFSNGVIIGPEGGFSINEVNLYKNRIFSISSHILKSECAAIALASLSII